MKRLLVLFFALLGVFVLSTNANAQSKPKMEDLTFKSSQGETLDFYSDYVIYHAEGSDVSRRGEYTFGGSSVVHSVGSTTWSITINIYVGSRTITMKGQVKAKNDGTVIWLKIDGKEWKM